MQRKLRMGMVGGGKGSPIGAAHRMAAQMDDRIDLVAGNFSSSRLKSREYGLELGLDPERVYGNYREMFRREGRLDDGQRLDFIAIVTPNNMHYPIAMAALDAGFHVLCEKPMTVSLDEAVNLAAKIKATKRLFCLAHAHTAYPMVREARALVTDGRLGAVRRVVAEYPQGWLATRQETAGNRQAVWRTDPKRAGISCCIGELGGYCHNLIEYVTESRVATVCAELATFVRGRPLDDDGTVILKLDTGAAGVIWASQVAVGEDGGLRLRVYGEKGSLDWSQHNPNQLLVHWLDKPTEIRRTGSAFIGKEAHHATRQPNGSPDGFVDALANIYRAFADALVRKNDGQRPARADHEYPSVHDGIRGAAFLEAVVRSAKGTDKWVPLFTEEMLAAGQPLPPPPVVTPTPPVERY